MCGLARRGLSSRCLRYVAWKVGVVRCRATARTSVRADDAFAVDAAFAVDEAFANRLRGRGSAVPLEAGVVKVGDAARG